MSRSPVAIAAVALVGLSLQGQQEPAGSRPPASELAEMRVYPAGEVKWQKGPDSLAPGAEMAVLEGDPSKPAPFVFRLKLPDGFAVLPHVHPKAERVTVIKGALNIGMGEKFDKAACQAMPAGSFGYWPAGMKHFGWFSGETILQLHGTGPWQINYLNPADDPRNAGKK